MTAAGWTQADLGAFTAAMQLGAVTGATIETLMRQPKFRSGSLKMHKAKWRPNLNGAFVAGALGSGLSVQLLSILVDEAGFDAASRKWLTPGWTANEVGRIAGKARQEGLLPQRLTAFLDTANAATSAFALKASWGTDEVGKTVGYCRTLARTPTVAKM
jgi:hypothetical protein